MVSLAASGHRDYLLPRIHSQGRCSMQGDYLIRPFVVRHVVPEKLLPGQFSCHVSQQPKTCLPLASAGREQAEA